MKYHTKVECFGIEERIQYPDVLQRAKINIIERKTCNKWLNGQVKPQMICAGEPEGGKDTCTVSYFNTSCKSSGA